jgi:hypothetical protein
MLSFIKSISLFTVLAMLLAAFPANAAQAKEGDDKSITIHEPQSRVSDEINLSEGGGSKWLWILLGAAVVVGGIAAIAGSSEASDQPNDAPEPDTGSVSGTW